MLLTSFFIFCSCKTYAISPNKTYFAFYASYSPVSLPYFFLLFASLAAQRDKVLFSYLLFLNYLFSHSSAFLSWAFPIGRLLVQVNNGRHKYKRAFFLKADMLTEKWMKNRVWNILGRNKLVDFEQYSKIIPPSPIINFITFSNREGTENP